MSWPVTKMLTPWLTDGCASSDDTLCWHCWNGSVVSFCRMAGLPLIFCPSNVSSDCSWYRLASACLLVSKVL